MLHRSNQRLILGVVTTIIALWAALVVAHWLGALSWISDLWFFSDGPVWHTLDRWQTLLGGTMALGAGGFIIWSTNAQLAAAREERSAARRADLVPTLATMSETLLGLCLYMKAVSQGRKVGPSVIDTWMPDDPKLIGTLLLRAECVHAYAAWFELASVAGHLSEEAKGNGTLVFMHYPAEEADREEAFSRLLSLAYNLHRWCKNTIESNGLKDFPPFDKFPIPLMQFKQD